MSWLTHLRTLVTPKTRAGQTRLARRSTLRLSFEALEDRLTPAVGDLLQTIYTPLQSSSDQTGRAITGSDELIVIGTPNGFTPSGVPGQFLRNGAVHVYDNAGSFLYSLGDPQTQFTEFGSAVAMVGSNILVGAPRAGRAYLFDGFTGNYLQTFINPAPGGGGFFGCAVAAVGNNVLIGARLDNLGSGAAYLFDIETGALLQTFQNPTPAFYNQAGIGGDQFGSSVAAFGENVLIGAPLDDTKASDSGAAYLFDSTTGALLRTIINPTPGVGDRFGSTLTAVAGNIAIGAQFDDAGALDNGAVHVFHGTTGALLRTITNPTPGANEEFGCSVAVVGSNLLVGSLWDRVSLQQANVVGGAYLIDGQNFSVLHRFINPTPKSDDKFGYAVAGAGHNILIGAPLDDLSGFSNNGAAYLYDGATYVVPAGGGPSDLLVQPTLDGWRLYDNNTSELLASGALGTCVVLVGADDESDRVTIDSRAYLANNTLPISFDGGSGSGDTLIVIAVPPPTPPAIAIIFPQNQYLPSGSLANSGAVLTNIFFSGQKLALPIGFTNAESVELNSALFLGIDTPKGVDVLTIDATLSSEGQEANVISGTCSSIEITPLTFLGIPTIALNAGVGSDRISISEGGMIAEKLSQFLIDAGVGDDEFMIAADSYSLPVSGGYFTLKGGDGIDHFSAVTDNNLILGNPVSTTFGKGPILSRPDGGSVHIIAERFILIGGSGNNRIDASQFPSSYSAPGQPPPVTIIGGDGDDTLIGTARDDLIIGGAGDDTINAGNGFNTIDAGTGDDLIIGGTGRDIVTAGDGDDTVTTGLGDDIIDGGEGNNSIVGGDGNDRITALSGNDEIFAGTGNDIINAGAGQNYVDGGTGDDVIISGEGDDTLIGGTGNDTLDAGDGNDKLDGGSGNNRLLGGSGDDELLAGAGVDFLDGGEGADLITGGAGNDTIRGGAGNDTINAGDGNDNVDGGTGDDTIDGGTGNDTLLGGDDNDTLKGGTGIDLLDGGLGFDTGIEGEILLNLEG